jgi:NADH-quinone oxidoreductase subunit J
VNVVVYVAGVLAFFSAVGVVAAPRTIYSALSLVLTMISLAVLFLVLNAQFLAAVQVIIYAGAIMVLFVFIIALLSPGSGTEEEEPARDWRLMVGLIAVAYITVQVFVLATNGTTYDKNTHVLRGVALSQAAMPDDKISFQYRPDDVNANGNVQTAGGSLFTTFLLPFEITSLLLLVAAIGAVYLTRRPPADR